MDLKDVYLKLVPKINDYIDIISNKIIYKIDENEFIFKFDPNNLIISLDIKIRDKIYYNVEEFDKSSEKCKEYNDYYNF